MHEEVGEEHAEVAERDAAGDDEIGDVVERVRADREGRDERHQRDRHPERHLAGGTRLKTQPRVVVEAAPLAAPRRRGSAPRACSPRPSSSVEVVVEPALRLRRSAAGSRPRRAASRAPRWRACRARTRRSSDGSPYAGVEDRDRHRRRATSAPTGVSTMRYTLLRDGRRVVHHAEHRVSDALVVERGHRQRLDPLEELRAVVVVEVLREPHREAEVDETEEAARHAEAGVRVVLGARRWSWPPAS